MTRTGEAGGGPLRRSRAFTTPRLLGGARGAGFAGRAGFAAGLTAAAHLEADADLVVSEVENRVQQTRAFHAAKAAAHDDDAGAGGAAGGGAGLVATAAGPNWVPLGPFGAAGGQASGLPLVSGRVQDVALSREGQRVYLATAQGGVWRSVDAGHTWDPMTDGLDLMETGGLGVTALASSLATGAVALAEGGDAGSDRLYVGTGEPASGGSAAPDLFGVGMIRSDDGGRTWQAETASPSLVGSGVYELALDPGDREHVLVGTQRGVYRRTSATAGTANPWRRESLPGLVANVRVTSVVAGRLSGALAFWAGVQGGAVFQWTAAAGWTALPALPTGGAPGAPGRFSLACSTGETPVLYALAARAANHHLHGVHRYDPVAAPAAWSTVAGAPAAIFGPDPAKQGQGWYDQAIVVDPTDATRVYVAGSIAMVAGEWSAGLYRLVVTPAGAGFTCTSTLIGGGVHGDVHAVVMRPGVADELWVGCDGGIFVSGMPRAAGDRLFDSRNAGLCVLTLTKLAHLPGEDSYAFAGAQDNGGLRYSGSEVWEHQLAGDGGGVVLDYQAGNRLVNGYINTAVRRAALAGARYADTSVNLPGGTSALFYPPLAQVPPRFAPGNLATPTNPGDAVNLAIGSDVPYVSTVFGGAWTALPPRTPATPAGDFVSALAFVTPNLLWAGWTDGHVTRYDQAPGWIPTDVPNPGETRPVTSIAVDPSVATGDAVFVTFGGASGGGARVWRVVAPQGGPAVWTAQGAGLLDIQHNAIVVDPQDARRRWVGADLGVWRWDDGASTWRVLSDGLPDAAVLDLDLLESHNLLRATTYGRGAWELDVSGGPPQPVRLALRASAADRGRPGRPGVTVPATAAATPLDASPDILVDPSALDGRFTVEPVGRRPSLAELRVLAGGRTVLASVPDLPVTTRVHVIVRNRGVRANDEAVDGVRVALMVGPAGADDVTAPTDLPAGYTSVPRDGTVVEADGWRVVGFQTLTGLRAGRPGIATFDLSSTHLPVLTDAESKRFVLVALVHHAEDPFPDPSPRVVLDLVRAEPRAAVLRVTAVAPGPRPPRGTETSGAGVGDAAGPPIVSGQAAHAAGSLLVPLTTALLAHQRMGDVVDQLTRKMHAGRVVLNGLPGTSAVRPNPVERRVLALATAARDGQRAGPAAGVPLHLPGSDIGQFTLLGALGFELPTFASAVRPDAGWIATALRRGTPDPHRSRVAVPSSELPLAVAAAGLAAAGADVPARSAVTGLTHGMLAAAAAGVAVSPQLTDLLAVQTRADWSRAARSDGAVAVDHHLRARFLDPGRSGRPPSSWLPDARSVPDAVWTGYLAGIEATYGLTASRPLGLPAFEKGFRPTPVPGQARLRTSYALVLDELRGAGWPAIAWFGLLTPVLLAPSIAMLASRDLPNARAFFTPGATVGERAVFELLTTSMGVGALSPAVYSILASAALGGETEALITSIGFALARTGLVAGGLATADDASQDELTRWAGLFLPLASMDVYAAIRAGLSWDSHPALGTVLLLQTLPAMTGLLTLGVTALLKATGISHDWPFWLSWSLFSAGLWLGAGIPLSIMLAGGGSWRAWMLHSHRRHPLADAVAAAGLLPPEPVAAARVLDDSTLWPDPNAPAPGDLAGRAYPRGTTPLVRVWWPGPGALTVRYADDVVTLRRDGGEVTVRLPAGTDASALAQLVAAALPGVRAEVFEPGAPSPALPWPQSLDDPGVNGSTAAEAVAAARFVTAGSTRETALVLRHSPRADHSTRAGLAALDPDAFPVVPTAGLGDLEGSGLGAAADLAVLLSLAAAPSLGTVTVDDGLPALPAPAVGEVVQTFRRWNLDERRLVEWQQLVSGGAPVEGAPPATPDPLWRTPPAGYAAQPVGADLVQAMGWIPLWRAWLRVAGDLQADAAAPFALASTPLVRFPDGAVRRPTNAELTQGVRYLLDLGAT